MGVKDIAGAVFSRLFLRALVPGGLALSLLNPGVALAGHAMTEGNACMDCHDLKVGDGEPDTSYLGSSKRNISSIKAAWAIAGNKNNGKDVPDEFGCLYCHNSPVLKDDPDTPLVVEQYNRMRDASNHFRGKASAHPVGYDLTTSTDMSGHLLSTFDCYNGGTKRDPLCADDFSTADGLGDRARELDCVDCHDVTQSTGFLGYPQHGKPLAANPLMLRRGVDPPATPVFNLATGEYDDVCRRCHGSATGAGATGIAAFKLTGRNLRLTVHQDASDITTNVLKEYDGTLLKVADPNSDGVAEAMTLSTQKKQCSNCHAPHYSSTNKKLFATGMDVANGSKCTDCHFAGDKDNIAGFGGNFFKYGHGKAGIGFGCSSCHSVNADHDAVFPANDAAYPAGRTKMFGFSPDTTPSKYGKDLTSICKTCHPASQYAAHTGGTANVGCIDCHDEHAEGVGSTSNRFMIPRYLPNIYPRTPGVDVELSFFQSDGTATSVEPGVYDYFVADGNVRKQADMPGVNSASACDNAICHAGLTAGAPPAPLSPLATFMSTSRHTGADQSAGSNCNACHSHTDSGGSWAANSSCTSCHGQPPINTASSASGYLFYASNADESKTPHARHVVDYGFGCRECHNQWTSAATHSTATPTFESIWFDPARNPDAALYPSASGYTVASSTCNSLYCHSDGQRHQVGGSVGTAVWMTGQQTPDWSAQDLTCNACHGTTNGTVGSVTYGAPDHTNGGAQTANSHGKHPYACAVCHNATTQDTDPALGWALDLAGLKHVNGSIDLLNGGGYTFTPAASHVCNNISCHGGNSATWGGASLSCDGCHFRTTAGGGDRNNFAPADATSSLVNTEEWTTTGHGRTTAYPSGNVAAGFASTLASDLRGCLYCHDAAVNHSTATNPFRLRNNNALAQGLTAANAYGWNDTCLVCHSTLSASGFDPDGAGGNYSPENGLKNVNENHYGPKHTGASQGGTFCWDCHDPHGDTMAYMIQGPNGGNPGDGATMTSAGSGSSYYGIPTVSRAVTGFDPAAGGGTPPNYNSSDFVNAGFTGLCQTCHAASGGALYFNQSTNTALTSHHGADTTRCTSCHPHAKSFGAACNACHGYPPLTAADMATRGPNYPDALVDTTYGGYAGGGDAHNAPDHIATNVTAADDWTPCLPCHPSTSHPMPASIVRANVNVSFPAAYNAKSGAASFTAGAGPTVAICSNVSCHGGQVTPVWSGGPLNVNTCSLCHIVEPVASQAAATQWNSAWSGLHGRAGSVSLENHTAADASVGDILDSSTCNQCHGLPALHFSGMDTQATDALADADFVTTYDGTGGNISATTGCKVTCHSDTTGGIGGTPRWARKWSATVTATNGTECANCHGTWTDGWVTGLSHRTDAQPSNVHGQTLTYPQRGCNECHAIGDAAYDFNPKWDNTVGGFAGSHGNEVIELNTASSANPQRLSGADAGETGCTGCHLANDGFAAGQHGFPTVSRWSLATLANGQYSGCTNCHGTTGTNFYPDGGAQNGTAYENRAGAHLKHIAAIVARNAGVIASNASSCNWCHPGGGHSGDQAAPPADVMDGGATNKFKTITGGTDADGAFVSASSTCTNIDCHSGVTTPGWYYAPDTAAPTWATTSGIAATNPVQGGVLNVTWSAATDAYPSNPVTYDLYKSTTNSAAAVFTGPPIATGLVGTGMTVTGLTDGTLYYFGVRAKDNWPVKNATANTDISTGVAPTFPAPPAGTVYYLNKPSSNTNLWTGVTTNLSLTCGTATTGLAVSTAPVHPNLPSPAVPPAGRGLLSTTKNCGSASTNNYMAPNSSLWYDWRNFAGFYSAPYTYTTFVRGSSTGNNFGFKSAAGWEYILVLFAAVDASGNHTGDPNRYVIQYSIPAAMTAYSMDLSSLSVTVPAGGRLAVLYYYYYGYSNPVNAAIAYDNYSAGITNQITLTETIVDTFVPTWSGGVSGIAAQDAGTDGVLQISWNSATDPGPATTPPVLYDLYRVQSAACTGLWDNLNLYRPSLGSTSFQDTGLTNGLTYCYGVRAKDSVNPPNATAGVQTATATPSRGAAFGCNSCHASPPTSAGNAGSHAAHANNDADYTDCNNCHPGTTSYTNSHQSGSGQLAFDGSAATAVYAGNSLTYSDPGTIYSDGDGYGVLTGSTGDGVDDGTCFGTPANYYHGAATPTWGGTLAGGCGSCHNAGGGDSAPTVTMTSSHTTVAGGCTGCHAGHFKGVRIPLPPASWSNPNLSATNMQTQLGIGYTNAGGIDLGGPGTVASINSKTTEAEICWGCHDAVATPVAEWGYNTKTTPAGYPAVYGLFTTQNDGTSETKNFGWIYNSISYLTKISDWTQGYWMSQYDTLLKRRVASIHTANFDPAGQSSSVAANVKGNGTVEHSSPTLEYKGAIRCSYCHDVHNTFGPDGKPYLRGSWVGDPYPPELPPRSSYTYSTNVGTGSPTPRGLSTAQDKGGYFIDQNSNWPTMNAAMDTVAETAGLCTLCHGTNVNTMDFYSGSKLWLAGMPNGHSNSTLGGTRTSAVDLFTGNRTLDCGMGMQNCVGGNGVCAGYPKSACGAQPNYGAQVIVNSGWYWGSAGGNPVGQMIAPGGDFANWYGTGTIGGADGTGSKAHAFTCSKCHSPHATGLPALLTQNCIDPSLGSTTYGGLNSYANNCHRKSSTTDGWHVLAPGQ